ncbi:MAG: hypothetical protein JST42_15720 [Bacteroidetes bacterium]|nr:hypothetical protein [Bacteroidota bacterium]
MIRLSIKAMAIFLLWTPVMAQSVEPIRYWNFDSADRLRDSKSKELLNVENYKCKYAVVDRGNGKAIDLQYASCPVVTSVIRGNVKSQLTLEFLSKGKAFEFTSFPSPEFHIYFTYPILQFTTTVAVNGHPEKDDWIMQLNGAGRKSYNYYTDGNWHHWVFVLDAGKGIKQVYVDGQAPDGFTKSFKPGSVIYAEGADAFTNSGMLDEIAFYNTVLPPELIAQHYYESSSGAAYSFQLKEGLKAITGKAIEATNSRGKMNGVDTMEFAPGYPAYTVQATDQLKAFPLPRFLPNKKVQPNFPWTDITYLHRELPGRGGAGFGESNPHKAVELSEEMASNWNYYVEVPCLRNDSTTVNGVYKDPNSVQHALIDFSNRHPEYPVATVAFQLADAPKQAGFSRDRPYIVAQDLPDIYYMRDEKGRPIVYNGQKWLSPLCPLDSIRQDGFTTRFYLRQLLRYLHRPINMINENGEIFNHMRPEALIDQDPRLVKHREALKMNNSRYNGWFQQKLDTCYKDAILALPVLNRTKFSFYNVSAYNPTYWPGYSARRYTNSWFNNMHYSTPSFYPAVPEYWLAGQGSYNGFADIAYGRVREIAMGDKLFSPFVSAGWGFEENNVRPAEWLGLLKSMVMLGADFFYTGYFNTTGATGWPNGKGPNDPRGYIYQVAMPAYAQAIGDRIWNFLTIGQLINPVDSSTYYTQYRLPTERGNDLVVVRKLNNRYLIFGSINPMSNIRGNAPVSAITTINLEGMKLSFEIRRQGSVYVLDLTNRNAPVFYQLDAWHQYEHPYFWTKDYDIEAEVFDRDNGKAVILTERPGAASAFDFSKFTSFVRLNGESGSVDYNYRPRETKPSFIYFRARGKSGKAKINLAINGKITIKGNIIADGNDWKWYKVMGQDGRDLTVDTSPDSGVILSVNVAQGQADIDKIILSSNGHAAVNGNLTR